MVTFHPFPRLPYELRMQIWEMTVEPRTISIRAKSPRWRITSENLGKKRAPDYLVSSTPAPAVLHVCREARNHGLYQKGFSELANPNEVGVQYVWLNWEIDMIDIGLTSFEFFFPIAHLFQRLKFERNFEWEWFFHDEAHKTCGFENLKDIHVVCAEPYGPIDWLGVFDNGHYWPCGKDNMYFIDKTSGQVFRGEDGLDEIERLHELKLARADMESDYYTGIVTS